MMNTVYIVLLILFFMLLTARIAYIVTHKHVPLVLANLYALAWNGAVSFIYPWLWLLGLEKHSPSLILEDEYYTFDQGIGPLGFILGIFLNICILFGVPLLLISMIRLS